MFTSSLRALTLFVSFPILCFDFGPALYLSRHMEHGVPRATTEPHAAEHHHSWEVSCIGQSLRENHATFAHAEKLRNSLFRASLPCSGEFFYPLDLEKTRGKFMPSQERRPSRNHQIHTWTLRL